MELTTVYDCTGANLGKFPVPPGVLLAGYVTGSAGVPWTPQQWADHPGAVQIDQSPVNTLADEHCDVIDMEQDAATLADLVPWVHAARTSYALGVRPGQRQPAVYMSESNVTPVVNALIAGGIASGVNLWVAGTMTAQAATDKLNAAGGPFPIIGVQYQFNGDHDVSLFSTAWLNNTSKRPQMAPQNPMMQTGWRFCRKCQGLFWGPGEAVSACPRGGLHDGSASHEYTIEFVK